MKDSKSRFTLNKELIQMIKARIAAYEAAYREITEEQIRDLSNKNRE